MANLTGRAVPWVARPADLTGDFDANAFIRAGYQRNA